ncbi:uracil-DNA glycosylase [Mycoplasma sp. AC1221]
MKDSFLQILQKEGKESYFDNIFHSLKEAELNNQTIYPHQIDIFKPFEFFQVNETKVVILGQDPYYNDDSADGLAFSSWKDETPKSLANIFKVLKQDYPDIVIKTNSLVNWAKQGVLLMNTVLTVIKGKPNSHKYIGWQKFTSVILDKIIEANSDIIFVILGKQAKETVYNLSNFDKIKQQNIIKSSHPSPLSFNKGFNNSQIFLKINHLLKTQNKTEIDWNLPHEEVFNARFTKTSK